jgi:hypothetical protein
MGRLTSMPTRAVRMVGQPASRSGHAGSSGFQRCTSPRCPGVRRCGNLRFWKSGKLEICRRPRSPGSQVSRFLAPAARGRFGRPVRGALGRDGQPPLRFFGLLCRSVGRAVLTRFANRSVPGHHSQLRESHADSVVTGGLSGIVSCRNRLTIGLSETGSVSGSRVAQRRRSLRPAFIRARLRYRRSMDAQRLAGPRPHKSILR